MRFLLLILVSLTLSLSGQGGYKRKYALANSLNSICYKAIEMPNGNIVMFGLTYDTIGNPGCNRLTLIETNPSGTILWRKDYGNYKFEYLNWISPRSIVKTNNAFYFVVAVRDSNNKQIGAFIKFNLQGDTLWQKVFRDPAEDFIPAGLTQSVDGGFLFTGFFQNWSNNTQPLLVVKTDINGNELWRKKIHKTTPDVHDGKALVQDSFSKKIVLVGYQYIGNSNNFNVFSNVMVLDSLGNKIIQKTLNNSGGGAFGEVIQLKDKNFLTCGAMNSNNDLGAWPRYNSLVTKFDTNGAIIWSKTFDTLSLYNTISCLQELPNGDIMMTGSLDTMLNYNLLDVTRVKVIKIDKDGNLKWRRFVGSAYNHQTTEGPTSICLTQDKGFFITSGFSNIVPRPYSLIKIDSTGCDTSAEWCLSVALALNNFKTMTGYSFDMFPNPATNQVNFNLEATADQKFNLKIVDITGRLLESITMESGSTMNLNLNTFSSGLYFVSIYSGSKAIETRKLVIEH